MKHPSSLPQHVEVELGKHWRHNAPPPPTFISVVISVHIKANGKINLLTWDVGQHDDDEAVVVVERHVIQVGESRRVHSSSAHERQSRVNGHQLPNDSHGVKDDEKVVSAGEGDTQF